jgi:hypothetical protein
MNGCYAYSKKFKMTVQNPFKKMSDEEWRQYVSSREPHFTSEPHYELISWKKLATLEKNASDAGLQLILRTTNNTAYCPGHVEQDWYQNTQWIFGLPGMQFMILLNYTEQKWMLEKKEGVEPPLKNYFSLEICASNRAKPYVPKEKENEDEDNISWDGISDYVYTPPKYTIESPKVGNGWVMNGGMRSRTTFQYKFAYVGPNAKLTGFGYVSESDNILQVSDTIDLMDIQLPPQFWRECIELNMPELMPGKFEEIQITHWSNTYVLPGIQTDVEHILAWEMDFLFQRKLLKSKLDQWVECMFGCDSFHSIGYGCWEPQVEWHHRDVLAAQTAIIESREIDELDSNKWEPYCNTIRFRPSNFKTKEIRLSPNATSMVKQVWDYINTNGVKV